jgi:hypothetical protein
VKPPFQCSISFNRLASSKISSGISGSWVSANRGLIPTSWLRTPILPKRLRLGRPCNQIFAEPSRDPLAFRIDRRDRLRRHHYRSCCFARDHLEGDNLRPGIRHAARFRKYLLDLIVHQVRALDAPLVDPGEELVADRSDRNRSRAANAGAIAGIDDCRDVLNLPPVRRVVPIAHRRLHALEGGIDMDAQGAARTQKG